MASLAKKNTPKNPKKTKNYFFKSRILYLEKVIMKMMQYYIVNTFCQNIFVSTHRIKQNKKH